MEKNKTAVILTLLCFIIPNAFAKSLDSVKGVESLIDGGKITSQSRKSTLKTKTKERNDDLETEYQAEPIYLGNFQFDLVQAWETIDYYAYNSDSNDYSRHVVDIVPTHAFSLENHNLFRITPFKKINLYAGFMESLSCCFLSLGAIIFESTIGGEIAVKFSKVALIQAALGLDVGFLFPGFIAPAFFFEFQAKFFPNVGFSPLIGMKFTKFKAQNDDTEHPFSISAISLYLGGSWNFRSKNRH